MIIFFQSYLLLLQTYGPINWQGSSPTWQVSSLLNNLPGRFRVHLFLLSRGLLAQQFSQQAALLLLLLEEKHVGKNLRAAGSFIDFSLYLGINQSRPTFHESDKDSCDMYNIPCFLFSLVRVGDTREGIFLGRAKQGSSKTGEWAGWPSLNWELAHLNDQVTESFWMSWTRPLHHDVS